MAIMVMITILLWLRYSYKACNDSWWRSRLSVYGPYIKNKI